MEEIATPKRSFSPPPPLCHPPPLPSGESLSTESSLLLIELYTSTHQLDKAVTHIEHVEVQLYGLLLNGRGDEGDVPLVNDQYRPRINFFKAQIHLLHKNVKACKKELKSYTSTAGNVSRMKCRVGLHLP